MFEMYRLAGTGPRPSRSTSSWTSKKACRSTLDGKALSPATLIKTLNEMGGKHGIGRVDMVENRLVGMKSPRRLRNPRRDDPGRRAQGARTDHPRPRHAALQGLLAQRYAELVYNGQWFTPLREAMDAFFEVPSRM